jgi:hypothetical protein
MKYQLRFYRSCWDIVNYDVMNLFYRFYVDPLDVQRLNYGIIILLPKIAEANKIQQFGPTCLLRCIYKFITKTMTLRLETCATKLISVHKNAFIKIET